MTARCTSDAGPEGLLGALPRTDGQDEFGVGRDGDIPEMQPAAAVERPTVAPLTLATLLPQMHPRLHGLHGHR